MVAKPRSEIQKAYRERFRAKDKEGYLKKERERRRRKKNYVPTQSLSRREIIRRNSAIKVAVRKHRERKLQEKTDAEAEEKPKLVIKMPFNQ